MTTISGHTTRANGTILTAAIYNADHVNHVTNAQALNATKMEGATPPVADGHAVVWNGTSGNLLRTAGFAPVSQPVYTADLAATNAAMALKAPLASPTFTGTVTIPGGSLVKAQGGTEGGELDFEKPPSGSTLVGNMVVDLQGNRFRVFDSGTPFKGMFADLTGLAAGIASKILTDTDFASQAQAIAGTDNVTLATPLRVAQAIAALAPPPINIGAALGLSTTGVDMGVDDSGNGAAFIIGGLFTTLNISLNGGSSYAGIFTSNSGGALVFARNGVWTVLGLDGNAPNSSTFSVARGTTTAGAGNIFFKLSSGSAATAIRIM